MRHHAKPAHCYRVHTCIIRSSSLRFLLHRELSKKSRWVPFRFAGTQCTVLVNVYQSTSRKRSRKSRRPCRTVTAFYWTSRFATRGSKKGPLWQERIHPSAHWCSYSTSPVREGDGISAHRRLSFSSRAQWTVRNVCMQGGGEKQVCIF